MQAARRAGASGEKFLALECCGLARDLRLSDIWHIPAHGYIHVVTGADSVWVYGKVDLRRL